MSCNKKKECKDDSKAKAPATPAEPAAKDAKNSKKKKN